MFFVISLTPLTIIIDAITGNNLFSSWFGVRSLQPGMVVQNGWAWAAWACCQCWLKLMIKLLYCFTTLKCLLNTTFANEPILCHFWYPCALAYLLCGLRSIPCTHLAIINQPQLKKRIQKEKTFGLYPSWAACGSGAEAIARPLILLPFSFLL